MVCIRLIRGHYQTVPSAAAERALLKSSFGKQQEQALEDSIQLSVYITKLNNAMFTVVDLGGGGGCP